MKKITVDKSWTCFLDRDGVINKRKIGGYIQSVDEFVFLPGVLHTIPQLTAWFGRIIIVTNQQGIGKGLFTKEDLDNIHQYMLGAIEKHEGQIDAIYYCPNLEMDQSPNRKPETGMAFQAQHDLPEIDFSKSIMIGDAESDMEFGRRLGMICIGIGNEIENRSDVIRCEDLTKVPEIIGPDKKQE